MLRHAPLIFYYVACFFRCHAAMFVEALRYAMPMAYVTRQLTFFAVSPRMPCCCWSVDAAVDTHAVMSMLSGDYTIELTRRGDE